MEDNPVSTAFEIFWMIFEPILFGITGAGIKVISKEILDKIKYYNKFCFPDQ